MMMLFVVISELTGVESAYEIPDVLWDRITPLLPSRKSGSRDLFLNAKNVVRFLNYDSGIFFSLS
jgi:hypothetical protein